MFRRKIAKNRNACQLFSQTTSLLGPVFSNLPAIKNLWVVVRKVKMNTAFWELALQQGEEGKLSVIILLHPKAKTSVQTLNPNYLHNAAILGKYINQSINKKKIKII